MAKYVSTIVIRQADGENGYWYVAGKKVTGEVQLCWDTKTPKCALRFETSAQARMFIAENAIPNMGVGSWDVYARSNPKPVSRQRKIISERYCQDTRIISGGFTTLKGRAMQHGYGDIAGALQDIETIFRRAITDRYIQVLARMEEKEENRK